MAMNMEQQDGRRQEESGLCPFPVIVRAYEDEPVKLDAVGLGPGFFIVRAPGRTAELQLPSKDVYAYDGERYEQLVNAFTRRDGMTLSSLWYVTPHAMRQ
jgi:hypothetical protein